RRLVSFAAIRRCDKTGVLVVGAAQAADYEVSTSMRRQRVKIKEIAEAMVGNTVWCCNSWFAPLTRPCAEVAGCTFKDRQVRLATPRRTLQMSHVPNNDDL